MPYDLSIGVEERILARMGQMRGDPSWNTPFHARGLQTHIGAPGASQDIGQTTNWQAAWIVSGDRRALDLMLDQAEAAGGIPWHFWDIGGGSDRRGGWLDVKRWPRFDLREHTDPGHLLKQPVPQSMWRRGPVPSHQPNPSFVPYLVTGRRAFLDNLLAQAAWNVSIVWHEARSREGPLKSGLRDGNVANGRQVRTTAWTMRTLGDAAWIAPDEDPNRAYLEELLDGNWHWLRAQIPAWTRMQGEAHGYIVGTNTGYNAGLAPWQVDYFASTAAQAARRGQADARAFLDWMRNFVVGRFFAEDRGFPRRDGVAYYLNGAPEPLPSRDQPRGRLYQTWGEIARATAASGNANGTDTWRGSNGEYPRLAMMSLALVAHVFDDARAVEAWHWLAQSDAPYSAAVVVARFPYQNVAPPGVSRVADRAPRCTQAAR
jgi:hypothetical protein